jgi:lipopolysaccharide biosynthesis glycosyltransferase
MENKAINIVLSTDNNYVAHTAALICSICENNSDFIRIHILINEVSSVNQEKLLTLKNSNKKLEILFYQYNEQFILDRIGMFKTVRGLSAFARIFIPELLPDNIHRAIYFDVDGLSFEFFRWFIQY